MRKVEITFTCILNGDMILLKKEHENWILPHKELEDEITSIKSTIKLTEQIFETKLEDITNSYTINHDAIINPWSIQTIKDVKIHHGVCISNIEPINTSENYYWTPLETLHKLELKESHKTIIKNYIEMVNTELDNAKIIKLYKELYHDVT